MEAFTSSAFTEQRGRNGFCLKYNFTIGIFFCYVKVAHLQRIKDTQTQTHMRGGGRESKHAQGNEPVGEHAS